MAENDVYNQLVGQFVAAYIQGYTARLASSFPVINDGIIDRAKEAAARVQGALSGAETKPAPAPEPETAEKPEGERAERETRSAARSR